MYISYEQLTAGSNDEVADGGDDNDGGDDGFHLLVTKVMIQVRQVGKSDRLSTNEDFDVFILLPEYFFNDLRGKTCTCFLTATLLLSVCCVASISTAKPSLVFN